MIGGLLVDDAWSQFTTGRLMPRLGIWLLSAVLAAASGLHHAHMPLSRISPLRRPPRLRVSGAVLSLETEERTQERGLRMPSFAQLKGEDKSESSPRGSSSGDEAGDNGLAVAGGALASSAVIAEGVQIAGTAVLFYLGQQATGTESPVEAVGAMIDYIQQLGTEGYAVFAALMIFLQVVPIAAAFVLTVSAGAIFGAVKGTATVLACSTISATISFLISRTFGRERLLESASESPQYRTIDAAFADASFSTSLTLITCAVA